MFLLTWCIFFPNVFAFLQTAIEERRIKVQQLSAAAEKLFDLLDVMTEGSKKKAVSCWPLQTMLLILCPVRCCVIP